MGYTIFRHTHILTQYGVGMDGDLFRRIEGDLILTLYVNILAVRYKKRMSRGFHIRSFYVDHTKSRKYDDVIFYLIL